MPEKQRIPIEHEGHTLLKVKVKTGTLIPYYQDGTRTAFVRGIWNLSIFSLPDIIIIGSYRQFIKFALELKFHLMANLNRLKVVLAEQQKTGNVKNLLVSSCKS